MSDAVEMMIAGLRGELNVLTQQAADEWRRTAAATQKAQVEAAQVAVRTAMAQTVKTLEAAISAGAERAVAAGVHRAVGDIRGVAAQTVHAEVQAVNQSLGAWRAYAESALRWHRWRLPAMLVLAGMMGAASRIWVAWCLSRAAAVIHALGMLILQRP